MKTNTAPWDHDRPVRLTPDERAKHTRYWQLWDELKRIIGLNPLNDLLIENGHYGVTSAANEFMLHELERFECTCNPRTDPCQGCRNRTEAFMAQRIDTYLGHEEN